MISVWELSLAVLVASVMGSLHCVGMCGPFALWASGAGASSDGLRSTKESLRRLTPIVMYHLGRLFTYSAAAIVVGLLGAIFTLGGQQFGMQSLAARAAGVVMVTIAVIRIIPLLRNWRVAKSSGQTEFAEFVPTTGFGSLISRGITKSRPWINRLPGSARSSTASTPPSASPNGSRGSA